MRARDIYAVEVFVVACALVSWERLRAVALRGIVGVSVVDTCLAHVLGAYAAILLGVVSLRSDVASERFRMHFFQTALAAALVYASVLLSSVPGMCVLFGSATLYPVTGGVGLAIFFVLALVAAGCADRLWEAGVGTFSEAFAALLGALAARMWSIQTGLLLAMPGVLLCIAAAVHDALQSAADGQVWPAVVVFRLFRGMLLVVSLVFANLALWMSGGLAPLAIVFSALALAHHVMSLWWLGPEGEGYASVPTADLNPTRVLLPPSAPPSAASAPVATGDIQLLPPGYVSPGEPGQPAAARASFGVARRWDKSQ